MIDADFLDSDLAAYLAYFGITRTKKATERFRIDGGPPQGLGTPNPTGSAPDSLEATLDAEALVSTAPGTALYVYETPSLVPNYTTDAYNKVVADNIVETVNSSFGYCENAVKHDALMWDSIALQGALKGITFHASTGDTGTYACGVPNGPQVKGVLAPASSPYVVAVGGTSLQVTATGDWQSEVTWNSSGGAGGGGVSQVFPLPSWQHGIPHIITTGRNLPDLSLDADPIHGIALYYGGSWNTKYNPLGGTSLASPLFGAAVTELDQVAGGRGAVGGPGPLYSLFAIDGYGSALNGLPYFRDVTTGCNSYEGIGGYCAMAGYDRATGLGSRVWFGQSSSPVQVNTLYSFGNIAGDGLDPNEGLTALNGAIYGTTLGGGNTSAICGGLQEGCGVVFKYDGKGMHTIHTFNGGTEGRQPNGDLAVLNGTVYGTTQLGGVGCHGEGCGTVFAATPTGTHIIHRFIGGWEGENPDAGLVALNGALYGTTPYGGTGCSGAGCGLVFQVSAAGKVTVLYRFKGGADGSQPLGPLVAVNGKLYGTTASNGANGNGTVFEMTPTGAFRVLSSPLWGGDPHGDLTYANGSLYGVVGSCCSGGTIFALTLTGQYSTVYTFTQQVNGSDAQPGLSYLNGVFYGATTYGGSNNICDYGAGCGTIFEISPAGTEHVIYNFGGEYNDAGYVWYGPNPNGRFLAMNGALYGTTTSDGGSLFELSAMNASARPGLR